MRIWKQIMEKKQTVPKHKLLSYPSVSLDKLLKKLSLCLWYRHDSSGVCSSMWGSSTGSVGIQTVLSPQKTETSRWVPLYRFCVGSATFICMWQVPMQGMWCMMRLFFLQPPPPPPLLSFQLNQMQPMPLLPEWPVITTPHSGWYCPHIHGSYLINLCFWQEQ